MPLFKLMMQKSLPLLLALTTFAANAAWVDDSVAKTARLAVVRVSTEKDAAVSGFFVSDEGLVITAANPLRYALRVSITTSDGEKVTGVRVMAWDEVNNLAVLATGIKPRTFLPIHERAVSLLEPCIIIHGTEGGSFKVKDGRFLARRQALDWSATRFLEKWSIALADVSQITGAPVVTNEGLVAGMCELVSHFTGPAPQKFVTAVPEAALADALANARNTAKPIAFPQKFESPNDDSAIIDADYLLGVKLMSMGNSKAALEKLQALRVRYPRNSSLLLLIATCLFEIGDYDESQSILTKASETPPISPEVGLMRGRIFDRQGKPKEAIEAFRDLTIQFPHFALAWGGLGEVLANANQMEDAVAAMKKCAELWPDSVKTWNSYSELLLSAGDVTAAQAAREHAERLDSKLFELRYSAPRRD